MASCTPVRSTLSLQRVPSRLGASLLLAWGVLSAATAQARDIDLPGDNPTLDNYFWFDFYDLSEASSIRGMARKLEAHLQRPMFSTGPLKRSTPRKPSR
jgi:hypothetical protein